MTKSNWTVFDVEADGLTPTKLYCLCYVLEESITTAFSSIEELIAEVRKHVQVLTDYEDMREFLRERDVYLGHNIRRWDIPNLERLLDIKVEKRLVDTLALSWYLDPDRRKPGLEHYGEEFGIPKPKIIDWHNQTLEEYIHRCKEDVVINTVLWLWQLKQLRELYPEPDRLWRFLRYIDLKMYCAHLAEHSGWKLDVEYCKSALQTLDGERERKLVDLAAAMPKVPIVKSYDKPKRYRNSDGQLSVLGQAWEDRLVRAGLPSGYDGPIQEIVGYDLGNPRSHVQIKDWLYSLGWVPQTIKFQRNKETGDVKEIPQINKEHGGGICESIKLLYDKEPALDLLDGLSVLSHRISILSGFLRDVDASGRLRAAVQGFTNTLRFKHAVLVNLPKVEKPYGEYIRSCLISSSLTELCGSDMSGLEDRLKQHFIFPHDPVYVSQLLSADYDPHLDIAVIAEMMTQIEADEYKAGNHKNKPIRSIAKNGNYACQYGAHIKRLMITCGISREVAEKLYNAYWEKNWAIKEVASEQTIKTIDDQMWLLNPISGFWYSLRTEKDIFSTLVQGSAAYCFDRWVEKIINERPQLTGQFHDEIILEVERGHQTYNEETKKFEGPIVDWLKEKIRELNAELKLNRELDIDVQFGEKYSEIH